MYCNANAVIHRTQNFTKTNYTCLYLDVRIQALKHIVSDKKVQAHGSENR